MEIHLSLDQLDPPTGRVGLVAGPQPPLAGEIRFTGWLGLLRALYELLGSTGR